MNSDNQPTTPLSQLHESPPQISPPTATPEEDDVPPDGGYGWVCVVSTFWINAHTWGINSSFSVFLAYYLSHDLFPGTSSLEYAFVGGLSMSCALLVAPLATAVMGRLGTRATRNIGAVFQFASLIGASFATKIWHLFLSQALCFGVGMGFLFVGTSGIPAQWFRRKRSLANGITAAGSGFGGLIYSLITNAMLEGIGLQWTFRALAIICLTMIVTAANLLRDRNRAAGSQHRAFQASQFRQPKFDFFIIWGFFSMLGYVVLIFTLADFAQASGLSARQGSITSAMLNLGQCIGRPLTGWVSMRLGRVNIAASFTFLTGFICLVMWTQTSNAAGIYSFAILAGMVGGTFWATVYAILVDIVGISDLPSSLSLTWVILFIPCTVAEPIALSLRGSLKGHAPYLPVQLFTGFMYVAAAMFLLVVRFWPNISQSEKPQSDSGGDQRAGKTSTAANQSEKSTGANDCVQVVEQTENKLQEADANLGDSANDCSFGEQSTTVNSRV